MNSMLKKVSVSLLLAIAATTATAGPGRDRDERDAQRAEQRRQFEGRGRDGGRDAYTAPDSQRRSGRMSPEERRALRRQINEAGQDIYAPRRR